MFIYELEVEGLCFAPFLNIAEKTAVFQPKQKAT